MNESSFSSGSNLSSSNILSQFAIKAEYNMIIISSWIASNQVITIYETVIKK